MEETINTENGRANNTEKARIDVPQLTHNDTDQLKRFVTPSGRILPRKFTGLTAKNQRHITRVIKRSRNLLQML